MFTRAEKTNSKLRLALAGPPGSGKAQPLDSKILTSRGWKRMGEMQVGDEVINSQGRWSSVIGVYPQGDKEIYRVTFTDGSSTECCADHLWLTQTHRERSAKRPGSVKPLHRIIGERERQQENNHFIPLVKPVEFVQTLPLPLDPYLLGVLLGDGCFQAHFVLLSNPERELQMQVRRLLPEGVELRPLGKSALDFGIRRLQAGAPHPVMTALRDLGLVGKKSGEKFIPDRYKFGSVSTRIAMLNGLLDTDGHTHAHSLEYSTSSPRLAQDVQFLVESLGGKAHLGERIPHYTHRGEYRTGARSYRVHISLPPTIPPFRLQRKANCYLPRSRYLPTRAIKRIDFVGIKEAQCIAVDAPDQLYVTDHCILTHNTYTALTLANALADGQGVALIDTEHGSASKYADLFPPFDRVDFETFHPDRYIEAIHAAEQAGYGVLVIDSLSHAWNGKGGLLELVDTIAKRSKGGNSYAAWADVTPVHTRLVETILGAKVHILATLRSKLEYSQERDPLTNRTVIRKLGLAPIQRDGVEYEFDLFGDLDLDNTLVLHKSRCPALAGAIIPRPGAPLAAILRAWLRGEPPQEVQRMALAAQITSLRAATGETAPDAAGMAQASEEQLRKERDRLASKQTKADARAS